MGEEGLLPAGNGAGVGVAAEASAEAAVVLPCQDESDLWAPE